MVARILKRGAGAGTVVAVVGVVETAVGLASAVVDPITSTPGAGLTAVIPVEKIIVACGSRGVEAVITGDGGGSWGRRKRLEAGK